MNDSKHKTLLIIIFGVVLVSLITLYWWQRDGELLPDFKSVESTNESKEWTTYEISLYNLSFEYPDAQYVQVQTSTSDRLLRIQSNKPLQPVGLREAYSVDFFVWDRNDITSPSDCSVDEFDNHSIATNTYGVEMYTGLRKFPDGQEGDPAFGGNPIICIERPDHIFFVSGYDRTEENILERIFDSIRFTESVNR